MALDLRVYTQDLIGQGMAISSWLFRRVIFSNTGIMFYMWPHWVSEPLLQVL